MLLPGDGAVDGFGSSVACRVAEVRLKDLFAHVGVGPAMPFRVWGWLVIACHMSWRTSLHAHRHALMMLWRKVVSLSDHWTKWGTRDHHRHDSFCAPYRGQFSWCTIFVSNISVSTAFHQLLFVDKITQRLIFLPSSLAGLHTGWTLPVFLTATAFCTNLTITTILVGDWCCCCLAVPRFYTSLPLFTQDGSPYCFWWCS